MKQSHGRRYEDLSGYAPFANLLYLPIKSSTLQVLDFFPFHTEKKKSMFEDGEGGNTSLINIACLEHI